MKLSIQALNESELEEVFSRSSGPGGQNVNKISSKVTLRHLPTNIAVTVQDSRSQSENRKLARERLLATLQAREQQARKELRHRMEQERRKRSKRPRALKEKILETKRKRSQVKKQRKWSPE